MKKIMILTLMILATSNSYGLELLRGVYTKHITYSGYAIKSTSVHHKFGTAKKASYKKFQEDNNFLGLLLNNGYGFATMITSYNTSAKVLFKMHEFEYYISDNGFKIQPIVNFGVIYGYPKDPENDDFSGIFVPLINPAIRIEKNFTSVSIGVYSLDVITVVLGVGL